MSEFIAGTEGSRGDTHLQTADVSAFSGKDLAANLSAFVHAAESPAREPTTEESL